ncbi:MAG: class I SAM-dependent methyltransferase [Thermodesulfobacteriota bacterium]
MICRICGNGEGNREYDVREMMYGFRDLFRYFRCSGCGCLQIAEIPSDIARYYPDGYYSLASGPEKPSPGAWKKRWMRLRYGPVVFGDGSARKLLNALFPNKGLQFLHLLSLSLNRDMSILEAGCGSGGLLYFFAEMGIRNVLGADPFIGKDIEYRNGLKILKKEIGEVGGAWDLVMFHHSLEHIPSQVETMRAVSRLLKPDGRCLVRIPICSSYAWERYGVHWVQLDAPRHFYLHSFDSMKRLAALAGLEVCRVVHDSTAFQLWGSEQYLRDIPLRDKRSYSCGRKNSVFSLREMQAFKRRTKELNREGKGDQAIFCLKKA